MGKPYIAGNSPLEIQSQLRNLYKYIVKILNSSDPLENVVDLTSVKDTFIKDGSIKYVKQSGYDYILDKGSTATADGWYIVETSSGTGRWLVRFTDVVHSYGTITGAANNRFILPDGTEQVDSGGDVPDLFYIVTKPGYLRDLRVWIDQGTGLAATYFTIYKVADGSSTSVATTLSVGLTAFGQRGTSFNREWVNVYDRLVLRHDQGAGGTATKVSATWEIHV